MTTILNSTAPALRMVTPAGNDCLPKALAGLPATPKLLGIVNSQSSLGLAKAIASARDHAGEAGTAPSATTTRRCVGTRPSETFLARFWDITLKQHPEAAAYLPSRR